MSEGSSGEKTEQPTPKRLRDARQKGQVAKSKEIAGTLGLVLILAYILIRADAITDAFAGMVSATAYAVVLPFQQGLSLIVQAFRAVVIQLLAPILGIAIMAAIVGNIVQVGVLFAPEAAKPSLKKLNPGAALKKMVSVKNFLDFGKNILKVLTLGILVLLIVRSGLGDLVRSGACGLECAVPVFASLTTQIIVYSMGIFIIAAGADYALERWQFIKGMMMTKDEVKREYKEMEGDPHIKGRRRQLARELLTSDSVQATRHASAVVTNPTHYAVAIRYDREEAPLPRVIAKGENLLARQIIEVAEAHDVPIMQNVDLARALYSTAELDQLIPSDLIEPVAEVLRWVRKLAREREAV